MNRLRMPGRPIIAHLIAGVFAVSLAGCSRDTRPTETIATMEELPADIRAAVLASPELRLGFAVYSRNCVGCHGIRGDGRGPAAERLTIRPRDFTSVVERREASDGSTIESVRFGDFKFRSTPNGQLPLDEDLPRTIRQGLKGSSMPSFEFMPERERSAVIKFIKLYSPRWTRAAEVRERVPLPASEPIDLLTDERVWRGRYAYVAMGCHNCHGMTGRGDGPSSHALKDDWDQPVRAYNYHLGAPKGGATPMDIYRTFRTGVTPMPSYQSSTLGLVTLDRKDTVFNLLVEQEQRLIEPFIDTLPTDATAQGWAAQAPERFESYCDERAWDLVAYTLWLREQSKPIGDRAAAIWPRRSEGD